MKEGIKVRNLEGELEPYSRNKVYNSAYKAGASKELANKIVQAIDKKIYPNIKTEKIFREIKSLLRKEDFKSSLKFDLKQAMKRLGPTGFPFEKYIEALFKNQGFKTKINVNLMGKCCSYEIDILAEKNKKVYIGECKYRNILESSVDINMALINQARFLDIKKNNAWRKYARVKSILITNGKFTQKAIHYASCVDEELWGWNYPRGKGLEIFIENNNLYPITILPALTRKMSKEFIAQKKMLVKDILSTDIDDFAQKISLNKKQLEKAQQEAQILLSSRKA